MNGPNATPQLQMIPQQHKTNTDEKTVAKNHSEINGNNTWEGVLPPKAKVCGARDVSFRHGQENSVPTAKIIHVHLFSRRE